VKHIFASKKLQRLYSEKDYSAGYSHEIVKAFRKRVQQIAAARDERDLYALKSLHFEKLKGSRSHQRSIRLDKQYRLILEIQRDAGGNVMILIDIEDYH